MFRTYDLKQNTEKLPKEHLEHITYFDSHNHFRFVNRMQKKVQTKGHNKTFFTLYKNHI